MQFKTTDLCDACPDIQVCELSFAGYGRRRAFAGNIRTARVTEGASVLRELVNGPGNGDVLVIDGGGTTRYALFGDVMAGLAAKNGWGGVVVHGLIRDSVEIDAMDIGVKALGTVPRRPSLGAGGETDVPLQFGGIVFTPGARLVADADGIIVLPPGKTEATIDTAGVVAATAAYVTGR